MDIKQGEIYWIDLDEPVGSGPGYRHPYVIVQNNLFNQSRINTVVVCELTTNLHRAKAPGNILLDIGETNLPRQSVINVSQVFTVDKSYLGEYIGILSPRRIHQIVDGLLLLFVPAEIV
jgi:mRNA interferase MazF